MQSNRFLVGIASELNPTASQKAKIARRIQQRIAMESPLLGDIRKSVAPTKAAKDAIWRRIAPQVSLPNTEVMEHLKGTLHPSQRFKRDLKQRLLQLQPVQAVARGPQVLKWSAAFVLFGLLVRVSPFLFIASSTVAESEVLLVPTRGEISVSVGGLWQTVEGELALEPGMKLRTYDGEASIILHDDGVIRLAPMTTVALNDLSDRLEPASEIFPTLTLYTGKIWMHGLVPPQLRGITVTTSYGHVTVNEGSVSIAEDDTVSVEVYDRSAAVYKDGQPTFLTEGERTELSENTVLLVKKMPAKWFQYTWANQNLERDAVHRHDIAQMQHERRIAQAGILPTSPLYPVKRFAELMDVMMTFNADNRVQKRLQLAETRLNEAAALLYEGKQAEAPLEEYTAMLRSIVNGESDDSLTEFLVQRALAETTARTTAALPGDESYAIKKTVLETTANLPGQVTRSQNAEGALLLDGLAVMMRSVEEGKTDVVRRIWSDLNPYITALEDENVSLDPSTNKEARVLLSFLASSLQTAQSRGANIDPELLDDLALYMPAPKEPTSVALSEEEVMTIVNHIKENIFVYDMTRSRVNQFTVELRALEGHPDMGRILRRLAQVLPDGPENFPDKVYKEIVKLRWENAGGDVI
ncbi:MAG: hypothetical protein KC680_01010 [Candidatus Peregrinibacteria bacterium]|nr:hypothetical protein [Candidatus Peregrinibacteria bacterium]MCB9808116.1 hypothetical protein [Candidatus Peribacteria bacterium]